MNIGVLSDTHIPGKAAALPETVLRAFDGVSHIIHAGDIADKAVLQALEKLAPVIAVAGNVDPPELRENLGHKKLVALGGFTLGVVHGDGFKGRTIDRAFECFKDDKTDCIIFGHSHIPFCGYYMGALFLNPGSSTDKRRNKYYSFGMIELTDVIHPRIVLFDKQGIRA